MEERRLLLGESERIVKRYDFPQDEWTKADDREDSLIITDKRVIKRDVRGEIITQKEVLLGEVDQVQTTCHPRSIIEVSSVVSSFKTLEFFMGILAVLLAIAAEVIEIIFVESRWDEFYIVGIVISSFTIVPVILAIVSLWKKYTKNERTSMNVMRRGKMKAIVAMLISAFALLLATGLLADIIDSSGEVVEPLGIVMDAFAIVLFIVATILMTRKSKPQKSKKAVLKLSVLKRATDSCALYIEREFDTKEQATAIAEEIGALLFRLRSGADEKWG